MKFNNIRNEYCFIAIGRVNAEYRSAIAPFDLNSNGKLEELELNEEAQLAILDHPPVGKFDFVVLLMPLVSILNMVGVTIWPAFSYVYSTLSKPSSIRAEQPLLYEPCVECSNELEYNTALIGLEGICPNCKANITFPAPPGSDA